MANSKRHSSPASAEQRGSGGPGAVAGGDRQGSDRVMIFNGYGVMPQDQAFGRDDSEADEPDWSVGAYLQDRASERPVGGWIFNGPPPEFLRQAWREGRVLYGVLIAREEPGSPCRGQRPRDEEAAKTGFSVRSGDR